MNLSSCNLSYQEPSENLSSKQIGLWVAKTESQSPSIIACALDSEGIPVDPVHPTYNGFYTGHLTSLVIHLGSKNTANSKMKY